MSQQLSLRYQPELVVPCAPLGVLKERATSAHWTGSQLRVVPDQRCGFLPGVFAPCERLSLAA